MEAQLCKYLILGLVFLTFVPFADAQVKIDSIQNNSDRYSKGITNLHELDKEAFGNIIDNLSKIAPELSDYIVTFGYGDIYEQSNLSQREKQLIIISSLTTKGDALPQLKFHINAGLNIGLTPEEIKDVIMQTTPYVGFPEVLNGILVLKSVMEKREKMEVTIQRQNDCIHTQKTEVIKISNNHYKAYTDILINAPVEKVWNVLVNFKEMPNWSTSLQGIKGDLIHRNQVVVHFSLNGKLREVPHTLIYREGIELGWSDPMKAPFEGFVDNHRYRVERISNNQTRFIQEDDFSGLPNEKFTAEAIANLAVGIYSKFNRELKKAVESEGKY